MRLTVVALACLLCACSRYADFTLPADEQPKQGAVRVLWDVRPEPVLGRGTGGSFDAVDTLNPSVLRTGSSWLNLYSGYDGKAWHTGLAVSSDGLQWTRQGKVLSPDARTWEGGYIAANGSAFGDATSGYLYWYQGGDVPRIGLARSADGKTWSKQGEPVLGTGPRGSWDERGVADPYVIRIGTTYYMYYLGQDRARRQQLGLARSGDGVAWEKLRSNPVLEPGEPGAFDETGLGEPAVWQEQGSYWMLYTARDPKEYRRLGLARSQDGVRWTRVSTKPVLSGAQAWDSAVVCDPSVVPGPDGIRVWFGGGDRPEPAENLHGQIGYALLRLQVGERR
ncbi:MAG: hypothetical protein H7039_01340 [Bryobacteraceae bacterium]|nr:hypothetical protein [Bryobacteraceae bacterium]